MQAARSPVHSRTRLSTQMQALIMRAFAHWLHAVPLTPLLRPHEPCKISLVVQASQPKIGGYLPESLGISIAIS